MPLDTGSLLGERYRLGGVLGRGGAADVFRAHDTLLDRDVAVKVLRETTEDDRDRERFEIEARTVANLGHHGLVTVLDAGITTEQPYLVMELVDGETLGTRLGRGVLTSDEARPIGQALAESISYAHGRGVVHRDVKPANVLLGSNGRVKLADFGIARIIGDTVRHTRTGHAIGTAAYLAPEQVLGEEVTGAADVYALGLTLLEALTGTRAYPGPPTEAALARLARQPVVPTSLPTPWPRLLTAMTAREPSKRPSPAEVAATLSATAPVRTIGTAAAGDGHTAVLVDLPVSAAASPRTGRWALGATAALVVLLVAAGALVSAGKDAQPDPGSVTSDSQPAATDSSTGSSTTPTKPAGVAPSTPPSTITSSTPSSMPSATPVPPRADPKPGKGHDKGKKKGKGKKKR